jgi:hypothetical protein
VGVDIWAWAYTLLCVSRLEKEGRGMTEHAARAQQGHTYKLGDRKVIAMESGPVVMVRELDYNEAYPIGKQILVKASWLVPVEMRYYHGEVPK